MNFDIRWNVKQIFAKSRHPFILRQLSRGNNLENQLIPSDQEHFHLRLAHDSSFLQPCFYENDFVFKFNHFSLDDHRCFFHPHPFQKVVDQPMRFKRKVLLSFVSQKYLPREQDFLTSCKLLLIGIFACQGPEQVCDFPDLSEYCMDIVHLLLQSLSHKQPLPILENLRIELQRELDVPLHPPRHPLTASNPHKCHLEPNRYHKSDVM